MRQVVQVTELKSCKSLLKSSHKKAQDSFPILALYRNTVIVTSGDIVDNVPIY